MAQTQINPRMPYEKRNTDDIFVRNVIGGLLGLLNGNLTYQQVLGDGTVEDITVPFLFEMGTNNTEKYLQDNFITFGDNCGYKRINGNFDITPRGALALNSVAINAENITNRFVLGEYVRQDAKTGEPRTYVSQLYALPLTITCGLTIYCSTLNELLKIDQAYREFFYKNKTFYITYKGMEIGCRAGFADTMGMDKTTNYSMGNYSEGSEHMKLTMDITVESYQPVFDPTTEMLANNKIKRFGFEVEISDPIDGEAGNLIYILRSDDYSGRIVPKGTDLLLAWNWRKNYGDMCTINVSYSEGESDADSKSEDYEWNIIALVPNRQAFEWSIPDDFTDFKGIDVTFINDEKNCTVYKEPIVKVLPDPETGMVTKDSVHIVDRGYILTPSTGHHRKFKIEAILSYTNKQGKIIEHKMFLPVYNNSLLDEKDEMEVEEFKYELKFHPKVINIMIADSKRPEIHTVMRNITVI